MYKTANGFDIPESIVTAIRDAFPKSFDKIMAEIQWYSLDGYYGFNLHGMFVGVESDGYIHS